MLNNNNYKHLILTHSQNDMKSRKPLNITKKSTSDMSGFFIIEAGLKLIFLSKTCFLYLSITFLK